jgi:F0F1-type ATP synthase beta subunit
VVAYPAKVPASLASVDQMKKVGERVHETNEGSGVSVSAIYHPSIGSFGER